MQKNSSVSAPESTRLKILIAAQEQIYFGGYNNLSIDQLIRSINISKGAFYYHFKSKSELGVTLINEILKPVIVSNWIQPLSNSKAKSAIKIIQSVVTQQVKTMTEQGQWKFGCPLNNLAQEMSTIDENMRKPIKALFDMWIKEYEDFIKTAQQKGEITKKLHAKNIATTLVSWCEGTVCLMKASRDLSLVKRQLTTLNFFLESIKRR